MSSRPTVKTLVFSSSEDKNRKKKMVEILKKRGLIDSTTEKYILKGRGR